MTTDPRINDTTPDEAALLRRLAAFSRLMDHAFQIPGTSVRFGLDPILGLIPGLGDGIGTLASLYLLIEAKQLGVSKWDLARMAGNVIVDAAVSSVPFAGDVFDVFWKANDKNLEIIYKHLEKRGKIIDGEATVVNE